MKMKMKMTALTTLGTAAALLACSGQDSSDSNKVHLQVQGKAVECFEGSGAGNAPAPGDTELSCEVELYSCTDGATYGASCTSEIGSGSAICSCTKDGSVLVEDVAVEDECPIDVTAILHSCGWRS